ncbi:tyrosine-type recombinase/integrase [Ralstonia wenshanensis]|uniref:tyrosine-type recombinase/integrase n=1 Tax=Ralstonia wenshanensis TaxID=2842456 RepID=UPI002ABE387C|nr:tyrosine-type recombinase/integrase [Ralstonia wenshanensis]
MEFVSVANDYLLWVSLENANTASQSTWRSYAETLYDYFSWLSANRLAWDSMPTKGQLGEEISNIAMYRNWSLDLIDQRSGKAKIQASTVRKRLSQIMSFYRWAKKRKLIPELPWQTFPRSTIASKSHPSIYRHTRSGFLFQKDNLRPNVPSKAIPFLNIEQCRALISSCGTETLQLMTKLMLQSGLRNEECRTFPRKYVLDPSPQDRDKRLPIELSPADMAIKGKKPRRIYISWQLMRELFDYLNFGEGAQRAKIYRKNFESKSPLTFLNQDGKPWSEKGLNNAYRKMWASDGLSNPKLNFRITPHMLRHTFATLELYAESKNKNIGAALAWVRDRLGHSSLTTTTVYVHCLDLMGEADLNIYQREIDKILKEGKNGST